MARPVALLTLLGAQNVLGVHVLAVGAMFDFFGANFDPTHATAQVVHGNEIHRSKQSKAKPLMSTVASAATATVLARLRLCWVLARGWQEERGASARLKPTLSG